MSMISAQCDVLRDAADELAKVTNGIRSGVPASTWHGMTYVFDNAAHRLRQAVDTILELRCKLVDQSEEIERLMDENARLRSCLSDDAENARQIMAENAKLREFAQAMAEVAYEGQILCDRCRFFHGCYNGGKKEHEGRGCQWLLWARELGIEESNE